MSSTLICQGQSPSQGQGHGSKVCPSIRFSGDLPLIGGQSHICFNIVSTRRRCSETDTANAGSRFRHRVHELLLAGWRVIRMRAQLRCLSEVVLTGN